MRCWWSRQVLAAIALLSIGGRAAAQESVGGSREPRAEPVALDPARAGDAVLRIALFDLLSDRPAAALARLGVPDAAPRAAAGADRGDARRALAARVLAAEALARLGLDEQLERHATELLADPAARAFAPALRARLAVQAYARGDDAAALRFASGDQAGGSDGVLRLVAGLARLRAGALGDALSELAVARRAGGASASYAAYADAIARLRADSAAAPAALDSLAALAARGDGAVADRAAVTAAQLAHQLGQHAQAVRLATAVRGDAARADALLVHGWSLYRGGVASEAVAAFDEYARLAPHHPASGEAQVMAAQALLVAGGTPEAGRRLRAVAAALADAAAELERGRPTLARSVAEDLVARGATGDLFPPGDGLAVRLDGAGLYDPATLTAVVVGREAPGAGGPRLAVASDARGDDAPMAALATRLLHTPADPRRADAARLELGRRLQRLASADYRVAAAQLGVEREVAAQAAMLATAAAAQRSLAADDQRVDAITRRIAAARAALARTAAPRGRPRRPARADSAARAEEAGVRMLRDSVTRTLARLQSTAAAVRAQRAQAAAEAERLAAAARRGTAVRQARVAADAAEAERGAAARAVVEVVTRELDARVPVALAALRRDVEAAEFAAAGAAFFAASRGEVPRPAQVLRPRRAAPAAARP